MRYLEFKLRLPSLALVLVVGVVNLREILKELLVINSLLTEPCFNQLHLGTHLLNSFGGFCLHHQVVGWALIIRNTLSFLVEILSFTGGANNQVAFSQLSF